MKTIIGSILALLLLQACSREGETVYFVIPDGFRGEVVLRVDPAGNEIKEVEQGSLIEIPDSGQVSFKSLSPIREWHKVSVRTQSGTPISNTPGIETEDTICWHGGTTSSRGTTKYFVGTLNEYYAYRGWHDRIKQKSEQGAGGKG